MNNTICEKVFQKSLYVYEWLKAQSNVGEESITYWLLYEIEKELDCVKYRKFTRNEESKITGADWEWWFILPNKEYFCARVQAKKISHYKSYNRKSIKYKDQIKKLLEDSKKKGYASFYAFYSSQDIGKDLLCKKGIRKFNEGVFIADAEKIKSEFIDNNKNPDVKEILKCTNPLSCFFCCYLDFKMYMNRYYPNSLGFVKEIPKYVENLLRGEGLIGWEADFRKDIEEIDAILIVDLREINKKL